MKIFRLFQYRWDLFLIAEMFRCGGSRFVVLQNRFGISRSLLKTTLQRLIESGLILPNPGYGHPLRPEYILTKEGKSLGPFCLELLREGEKRKVAEILQDKWSCPVIFTLGEDEMRFNEIKKTLSPVTSRALSTSLKSLHETNCLKRNVIDSNPPAHIYKLERKSKGLYRIYEEHSENLLQIG